MAIAGEVERFKEQLASKRRALWTLLTSLTVGSRGFLRDAAFLALVAQPTAQDAFNFIRNILGASALEDAVSAAALVMIAAAAGCGPADLDSLAGALAELQPEQRVRVAGRLWTCFSSLTDRLPELLPTLTLWTDFLNVPQNLCPFEEDASLAGEVQVPPPVASAALTSPEIAGTPVAPQTPGLRGLVQDAPPSFRCAIDGQLLVDPVRSPLGHVFERSVLARSLQASGNVCLIAGTHLTLADCRRDPELRKNISAWIKSSKDRQKLPMMFTR